MTGALKLDEKDREIADLLRQDAWMTNVQIGERVHLSPSAVQRRVERMRSSGVITGAHASVSPALNGRKIRIYLMVELNDDSQSSLQAVVQKLRAHPEVKEVDLLAGTFDLILVGDFDDMESFSDFAMRTLNTDRNIRHCHTLTRLKKLI